MHPSINTHFPKSLAPPAYPQQSFACGSLTPRVVVVWRTLAGLRLSRRDPDAVVVALQEQRIIRARCMVQLDPKPFQICLAILSRAGGIITMGEIFDFVWGDDPDGGPTDLNKVVGVHCHRANQQLRVLGLGVVCQRVGSRCLVDLRAAPTELRAAA